VDVNAQLLPAVRLSVSHCPGSLSCVLPPIIAKISLLAQSNFFRVCSHM
jgi:hypothetical protein